MKKYVIFIVILCVLFCGGCVSDPDISLSDSVPQTQPEPKIEVKKPEKVGIYVDVTFSMQGFLGMNENFYKDLINRTKYVVCLDEINNIITSEYDNVDDNGSHITYYRVDTPLWKVDENVLEKAKDFEYYVNSKGLNSNYECIDLIESDGENYHSYCLTNALLNCQQEDFSLIVTDMYENDAASDEVIKALKMNMDFTDGKNRTIGIVGIKSEFSGTVYDLVDNSSPIEYGKLNEGSSFEDIKYRQFYVIVIGQYDVVSEFCEHLQENMNLDSPWIESAVFFDQELYGVDYSNFSECYSRHKEKENTLFEDDKIWINDRDRLMDVYEYINKTDKPMDIVVSYNVNSVSMETELLKGEKKLIKLPGFKEEMELFEIPFCFENQESVVRKKNSNEFEADNNLSKVFWINNIFYSSEEKLLYVWFQITNSDLPIGTLKLYGQICKQNTDQIRQNWKWVDDWNLKNWENDYEKTQNLKEYFNTMEEQIPLRNYVMVEFVFYINNK